MTDLKRACAKAVDNYQCCFYWTDDHSEELARTCISREIRWVHDCPGCDECAPLIESAVSQLMEQPRRWQEPGGDTRD